MMFIKFSSVLNGIEIVIVLDIFFKLAFSIYKNSVCVCVCACMHAHTHTLVA